VKLVGEDLVDIARPGDRVSIVGIVRYPIQITFRQRRVRTSDVYIEGNHVDTLEKELEITITPEEEVKIREVAEDPLILSKLRNSIAPSIYGYNDIKEAILYALFGGVPKKMPDGTHIRGDIHILLVGDPGTAKSQLLQYVSQVAPRGLFTSGRGTSAAGLTATVVRSRMGEFALEAGALVLADKGICCIDEIDKMRPEDRSAIHLAMEQQIVSISKASIVATLNTRTAILAAANPTLGRYDPFRSVADNISLPITILSRFDLIFILRDEPQREIDREMSEHILTLHRTRSTPVAPPFDPIFLRKYITYARQVEPKLSEEAAEALRNFYLRLRSISSTMRGSPIAITPRQLESLIRLAEARARVFLREMVTIEDAHAAINLWRQAFEKIIETPEGLDIDVVMTGKPKTVREKLGQVLSTIEELEKDEGIAKIVEIYEKLEEAGIGRIEAERLISELRRSGAIFSPKPGYLKKV
jgi:replicative DNA helicase Mcm